jgi:hypothetical protein
MLRILGRGHSDPTVTELIFVRAQIQLLSAKRKNAFIEQLVNRCALTHTQTLTHSLDSVTQIVVKSTFPTVVFALML